ncbi:MAG: sugar transporter [Gammaproteobacteria bacterium]|nr:sugar transporter [Gammaproteobacteria bacterium]
MDIRPLLPLALLASALALSACGNKGPLVAPPPPGTELPDADATDDATGPDGDDEPADRADDDGDGAR